MVGLVSRRDAVVCYGGEHAHSTRGLVREGSSLVPQSIARGRHSDRQADAPVDLVPEGTGFTREQAKLGNDHLRFADVRRRPGRGLR